MDKTQSLERQNEWTEGLYARWWQRMGEIFGRVWSEQFGDEMTPSWREELATWSVTLAATVLTFYRRAGLRFPPNLSEVAKIARELKPSLELKPPARQHEPNVMDHRLAAQRRRDEASIERYRRDHPGASVREAAMALLHARGITHLLPESVLADECAQEEATLRHDATVIAAKAKEFYIDEDAGEARLEREAIIAESYLK